MQTINRSMAWLTTSTYIYLFAATDTAKTNCDRKQKKKVDRIANETNDNNESLGTKTYDILIIH